MAKQTGAVQFIGKLANVVGFKNALAAKAGTKFVRERAATVSNPKSYAQAKQRAKTRPAQIFYDAFVEVLNHAFIPKGRASKNRLEFLSGAMSLDYVPDVMKGEFKLPIAPYLVSRGTLGVDSLVIGSSLTSQPDATSTPFDRIVRFPLRVGQGNTPDMSVGELSEVILSENTQLVEGQEITIIAIACKVEDSSVRLPLVMSFVLNRNNTISFAEAGMLWFTGVEDGMLVYVDHEDYALLSAALIISSKTIDSWKYTNSYMVLSKYAIDGLDWSESDVIRSYMRETTAAGTSDLILQQADNEVTIGMFISAVGSVVFTLNEGVDGTPSSLNAAFANLSANGVSLGRRVVVGDGGQLYAYSDRSWLPITLTITGEPSVTQPLLISQTSIAGNQTITLAEVMAAGF